MGASFAGALGMLAFTSFTRPLPRRAGRSHGVRWLRSGHSYCFAVLLSKAKAVSATKVGACLPHAPVESGLAEL